MPSLKIFAGKVFKKARTFLAGAAPTSPPRPGVDKEIILEIKWGGLGDHLFFSHLPRIAKETGAFEKVYLSRHSEFRQKAYRKLIWENNPFVDGYSSKRGYYPEFTDIDPGMNVLDKVMLCQGLDDGKRFHEPELFFKPPLIDALKGAVLYDPNFISYVGEIPPEAIDGYLSRNKLKIDFQMILRGGKSFPATRFDAWLEARDFEHFCGILMSCEKLYCLTSGTATLAAALGKPATVFYGKGQKTMFHHSKLHTYVQL